MKNPLGTLGGGGKFKKRRDKCLNPKMHRMRENNGEWGERQ